MNSWTLHFLNARGQLTHLRPQIERLLQGVEAKLDGLCPALALDIVIEPNTSPMPAEMNGVLGYAPRAGVIYLTLESACKSLNSTAFQQTLAHEFHHAMRWESVGYGQTLREAIITEGLAGHFVQEVLGTPPEPWETALSPYETHPYLEDYEREADAASYNHAEWFFGTGRYPNWLGYALGYQLVGEYLAANPGKKASALASQPADRFKPA